MKERQRNHPVPWWTAELSKRKRKEHKLYLQWKRSQNNSTIQRQLTAARREYKRAKRKAEACYNRRNIENIQIAPMSQMAEAVKRDMKGRRKTSVNVKKRGVQLEPRKFTAFMANVGNVYAVEELEPFSGFDDKKVPADLDTRREKAIAEMESNKAIGLDGIHVEMIKKSRKAATGVLKSLWQAIGRTGKIPQQWLRGLLIPVHKKGRQDDPSNYRPLCMLSHPWKVLEKAYVGVLDQHFETDEAQFGFQDSLSILQAVLEVEMARLNGARFFAILDLRKAFDKVVRKLLKRKLEQLIPQHIVQQLVLFLEAVEMTTVNDFTHSKATARTGLNQGGAISPALYRVYINDLPKRVLQAKETDDLDPKLTAIHVADDFLGAAKRKEAMQSRLDQCTKWASDDHAEWAPEKCVIMCTDEEDALTTKFTLAGEELRNTAEADYLGLRYTRTGFEEKPLGTLLSKGRAGLNELRGADWFNAGLGTKATRTLYNTHVRSRITYGLIVCRQYENTRQADETLQAEFFKVLLKLKTTPSRKQTEIISLMYRIHDMMDEISKQATNFKRKLQKTKREGKTEKLRKHAERSLHALETIGTGIVCGRMQMDRAEPWTTRMERRYDERRKDEGSGSTTSRKPNRRASWKEEKAVQADRRMTERRRQATVKWFIRRFPVVGGHMQGSGEGTLDNLRRWNELNEEERSTTIDILDGKIREDEVDWRRKRSTRGTENSKQ